MGVIRMKSGQVTLADDGHDYETLNLLPWRPKDGRHAWYCHRENGKSRDIGMHNVVAGWMGLAIPPGHVVDHKNRDGFDNRRENLRVVPKGTDLQNRGLLRSNKTGVSGVYWSEAQYCYCAAIRVRGGPAVPREIPGVLGRGRRADRGRGPVLRRRVHHEPAGARLRSCDRGRPGLRPETGLRVHGLGQDRAPGFPVHGQHLPN
jgi:hypothetical protein